MQITLMLIVSIASIIPHYAGAQTFEDQGQAILNRINNAALPKSDWTPSGPTAQDIQAGNQQAAKEADFFAKRDLGEKLRRAVDAGNLNDVKMLIAAGAELNVTNYWRMTPLMAATKNGSVEIVTMLINAGAHIDAQDEYGATALTYALDKGHTEIAKLLIPKAKSSCNQQALKSAIEKGYVEIAKLLIAHGPAKNAQADFGSLFISVLRRGDNQMAKNLMAENIALDHTTLMIAAHIAQKACSAEIAKAIEDLLQKSHAQKSKN